MCRIDRNIPTWNTSELQSLEQNEGLFAVQQKHSHGIEGWKKKKKRIFAKMKAVGRMNWALSMARALVSLFNEDIVLSS